MDLNARIYQARKTAKLTQEQLAAATGKTRGAVAQWEKGDVRPRHTTIQLIARATGASTQWLESGVEESHASVRMVGEVAAGIWREASLYFEVEELPIAFHPDYPAEAQRAYRIIGNSTNRLVRNGEYVHTVDIQSANLRPEEGDFVIVRRTEHGKAEYTAKTLVNADGEWVLRPESDDPEHQTDIPLKGDGAVEIEITDLVIARWSPINRRRRV